MNAATYAVIKSTLCIIMNLLWFILIYFDNIPVTTNRSTADIITVPDIYY